MLYVPMQSFRLRIRPPSICRVVLFCSPWAFPIAIYLRTSAILTLADTIPIVSSFHFYSGALHLASQCLLSLDQYEDCLHLLDPLLFLENDDSVAPMVASIARKVHRLALQTQSLERGELDASMHINVVASIYSIAGVCCDKLENRMRAIGCLTTALRIDPACVDAVEYISDHSLLSGVDRQTLYDALDLTDREWLRPYYKFHLLQGKGVASDSELDLKAIVGVTVPSHTSSGGLWGPASTQGGSGEDGSVDIRMSALVLVRRAERLYDDRYPSEAYRLSRQAYIMDPFDSKGLLIYIASMVELGLSTELFYLGHELSNAYPKLASSWYCVGCYYWTCKKLEHAQKYLQKAVKIDKRFARAWVALGHVLAAQEESEHAISAYRSASRLLPGDHRPLVYMAKELLRTNYLSLALHLLFTALRLRPNDPLVLNELGVVYLKQDRPDEAIEHLARAATLLHAEQEEATGGKSCGDEIFANYATALRRVKRFDEAVEWYQLCLAVNPTDAGTHANLGFTLHLMERYDEAISAYHKALSLQPTFSFCAEMLTRALQDSLAAGRYVDSAASALPAHLRMNDEVYASRDDDLDFSMHS